VEFRQANLTLAKGMRAYLESATFAGEERRQWQPIETATTGPIEKSNALCAVTTALFAGSRTEAVTVPTTGALIPIPFALGCEVHNGWRAAQATRLVARNGAV